MARRWAAWAILAAGFAVVLITASLRPDQVRSTAAPTQTLVNGLSGPVKWAAGYCISAGKSPPMQPVEDKYGNVGFRRCPGT